MDLVDKEQGVFLEIGEHAREIAWAFDDRSGSGANRDTHFIADDVRERRLAESRGTVEQHVIERFTATTRGSDRHLQVIAQAVLPDVLIERTWTQPRFILGILVHTTGSNQS